MSFMIRPTYYRLPSMLMRMNSRPVMITSNSYSSKPETIKDKFENAKETVKEKADQSKAEYNSATETTKEKAKDTAKDSVGNATKEKVKQAADAFKEDGAIGKEFTEKGSIGGTMEKVGGPFSSKGSIGKQFTKEGAVGGTVDQAAQQAKDAAEKSKK